MMKKKKGLNHEGFTLVEILVVLVILAILAAALIPSMIGFVETAKGKAYVTEARTVCTAVQAKVTEEMALKGTVNSANYTGVISENSYLKNILAGSCSDGAEITLLRVKDGKIEVLTYKAGDYYVMLSFYEGEDPSVYVFTVKDGYIVDL